MDTQLKFGRMDEDCTPERPFDPDTDNAANFPNPRHGFANVTGWCNTQFDLNVRECVALLGMYSKQDFSNLSLVSIKCFSDRNKSELFARANVVACCRFP